MRSASARDDMVARVQAAHAQWPTFLSLPDVPPARLPPGSLTVVCKDNEESSYIAALYTISANGEVKCRCNDMVAGLPIEEA